MLLTSSEIQKKLERGAFLIHVAHKQIEALQAQIAAHEEQMHDTAQSLYGNPALVEAAIAMANMSIPALEMKASKIVAESQSSTTSTSSEDELNGLLDPSTSAQSSDLDGDEFSGDDDTVVVEPVTDGNTLAKLHTEEFFGVEVPASQLELAREIKHEAAVSVKQNTKNNTYASDRGKNAWRKALFTRARAEYLKAGVSSDGAEDPSAVDTVEDTDVVETAAVEAIAEGDAAAVDAMELSVHSATDKADAAEVYSDEPTDLDAPVEDDQSTPVGDAVVADEPEDDHASETEVVEAELEAVADEHLDDADWLPGSEDDSASDDSEVLEASSAGFVDIPFFDEPTEAVASTVADEAAVEIPSTVNDDHTISITDTFFNDDDVPVLDPISFEEETVQISDHDEMSASESDEPEDIDVPDFDPNAELFDGDTEAVASEAIAVTADEPVVAREVAETFANERLAEATQQMTPEASRRAVSMSSIPPHQRPGAPRPQGSIPARPQPGSASGRVVTVPGPRPSAPAPQQTAVAASSTPVKSLAVSPAPAAPAAQAPTRAAPSRGAPSRSGDTPQRAHGYGANVPAPAGLDEAIRERDAAEAAAKAVASSTSSSAPSAPVRPSAPPARPGAPRGPAFTKPSFGR